VNLKDARVLVTGGGGFLGKVIVRKLEERGAIPITFRKTEFDLRDWEAVQVLFDSTEPDLVIHSAALYGGILINKTMPSKIYFENMLMGTHVIEASARHRVQKFVGVGTACSYPGYLEGPLNEDHLWDGPCHESVRCYGAVKKMMQIQCEAHFKERGFNGSHVLLANLYGKGDSYNTDRSHVVAALLRKFVEAKQKGDQQVVIWGSGKPIREFLYVEDAAEGILRVAESYESCAPINIGTGIGTSISELVETIKQAVEFDGNLTWDISKPDGASAKVFDVSKMLRELNWHPETPLAEGVEITAKWLAQNYEDAIRRW
jgi:GDP-L-fucose synthase